MASGMREMILNTQERAISTDLNRLQKFKSQDVSELMRLLLNVGLSSDDADAAGLATAYSTLDAPLKAEIINGFLVRPITGTGGITVDAGVLYGIIPDGSAEDSNYKYVRDPGVATPLVFGANASGQIRIDVIECSLGTADVVNDNRDIFNSVTGLFAATAVTKETAHRLQYRIRQGTPGSGLPANQTGWLPLAVASVPNGFTTVNQITFWDVRPLLQDRADSILNVSRAKPKITNGEATSGITSGSSPYYVTGVAEAVLNGRKIGGAVRSGSVVADADNIDLWAAANQVPSFSISPGLWFVYYCLPGGLPRWARYQATGSNRLPRAPRGIPVLSQTHPDAWGFPTTAIPMPTQTGLVVSTTNAYAMFAGYSTAGFLSPMLMNDKRIVMGTDWATKTPSATGSYSADFSFQGGVDYPRHATELRLNFYVRMFFDAGDLLQPDGQFNVYAPGGIPGSDPVLYTIRQSGEYLKLSNSDFFHNYKEITLPLPNEYPLLGNQQIYVRWIWSQGSNMAFSNHRAHIIGWKLG